MVNEVDNDGNGEIDRHEFEELIKRKLDGTDPEVLMKEVFNVFDCDKDNFITEENLRLVLPILGEHADNE
jgi:Ca2+-binding EF-hand superfamily protein